MLCTYIGVFLRSIAVLAPHVLLRVYCSSSTGNALCLFLNLADCLYPLCWAVLRARTRKPRLDVKLEKLPLETVLGDPVARSLIYQSGLLGFYLSGFWALVVENRGSGRAYDVRVLSVSGVGRIPGSVIKEVCSVNIDPDGKAVLVLANDREALDGKTIVLQYRKSQTGCQVEIIVKIHEDKTTTVTSETPWSLPEAATKTTQLLKVALGQLKLMRGFR